MFSPTSARLLPTLTEEDRVAVKHGAEVITYVVLIGRFLTCIHIEWRHNLVAFA